LGSHRHKWPFHLSQIRERASPEPLGITSDLQDDDVAAVSVRALLAFYTAANVAPWLYVAFRYGYTTSEWFCVVAGVLLVIFLWRGSRGAWLLSFVWAAGAFVLGMSLAEKGFEWLVSATLLGLQLIVLLTPTMREFVRDTAHRRAVLARRSW